MSITFNDDQHIYVQIADDLRNKIYAGRFGDKLPGIRDLAQHYSINFKTANKAVSVLIDEGLLYRIRGKGTFVVDFSSGLREHHLIGFILPDITNPNFARIVQALHQIEVHKNLSIIVNTTDRQRSRVKEILNMYTQRGISAIVVQGGALPDDESLQDVLDSALPIIGAHAHIEGTDDVWLDMYAGAQMATDHLIEGFGPQVGYISGSAAGLTKTSRFLGYRDALLSKGGQIDFTFLKSTDPTYVGGYKALKELLTEEHVPRSVFMYNQIMAMGAVNAITSAGLKIPEDIALIGCDDSLDADDMIIPISSIAFSYKETATQLLSLVERRLNNPMIAPEKARIAPKLIVRASSQPTLKNR